MKKLIRIIALAFALVLAFGAVSASAAAYTTYTYSYGGQPLSSPDAYSPYKQIDSAYMGLPSPLNTPTDLYIDELGWIYIADPVNNRIVVLDEFYKYNRTISTFVNTSGNADSLNQAQGLCVANGLIYIADTQNYRIVVLERETLKCVAIHNTPDADVVKEGSFYNPVALSVDGAGRMYVVSSTTIDGIISLNADGTFASFIGAQKVTYNAMELFWRRFQSAEERAAAEKIVSVTYNNITIDKDGFIYVTTDNIDASSQMSAMTGKDKGGDYHPVKKLNAKGNEIMRRNGFWPPAGEVKVRNEYEVSDGEINGPSKIVDVALGPEETWSIIDQKRSRIFTYDKNGNLLHAFGDSGTQLGNLKMANAIAYQGSSMLVLDKTENAFTIYHITGYGETLLEALRLTNNRQFTEAVDYWNTILQSNNNYDAAYVGIGDAHYRSGDYEKAMENYKIASDTESYSEAFKRWRKDAVNDYLLLIVVVIIAALVIVGKYLGYAGKINKECATKGGKRTFKEEFLFAHHVMFHPFDGFWDLKHEKRGSIRGATAWLALTVAAFCYNSIGKAYLFGGGATKTSVFTTAIGILIPVALWVTANWCLTTLFEGEGSFKDIYITTCYAAAPMPFLLVVSTLLTHVVSLSESGFVTLTLGVAWVWFAMLLFFGTMVTHDFQMGKNIITIVSTIVGMAVIMFVAVLFSGLLIKMATFVSNIITELTFH